MCGCIFATLSLSSCSSKPKDPIIIRVYAGLDQTLFEGSPDITQVELRLRKTDSEQVLKQTNVQSFGLELPNEAQTGIGSLVLVGYGPNQNLLAYGRSPMVDLTGLSNPTLGFKIFVPRIDTLTPAVRLTHSMQQPMVHNLGAQYTFFVDRTSTSIQVLDTRTWQVHEETSALPTTPMMVAIAGNYVLSIDSNAKAALINMSSSEIQTPTLPNGSFSEILEGDVVTSGSGAAFLIGATRTSSHSNLIVRLDPNGTLSTRRLNRPRRGAAAAWVSGRGVAILSGISIPEQTQIPVEFVSDDKNSSSTTISNLTTDAIEQSAAIALNEHTLLETKSDGTLQTLDLTCLSSCVPTTLPIQIPKVENKMRTQILSLESNELLMTRNQTVWLIDSLGIQKKAIYTSQQNNLLIGLTATGIALVLEAGSDVVNAYVAPIKH